MRKELITKIYNLFATANKFAHANGNEFVLEDMHVAMRALPMSQADGQKACLRAISMAAVVAGDYASGGGYHLSQEELVEIMDGLSGTRGRDLSEEITLVAVAGWVSRHANR